MINFNACVIGICTIMYTKETVGLVLVAYNVVGDMNYMWDVTIVVPTFFSLLSLL